MMKILKLIQKKERRKRLKVNDHGDLGTIERRLANEVDPDFFWDPAQFRVMQRVVDVLCLDDYSSLSSADYSKTLKSYVRHTAAYRALQQQQQVVEDAIQSMAVKQTADLHRQMIHFGSLARSYHDAVTRVPSLQTTSS